MERSGKKKRFGMEDGMEYRYGVREISAIIDVSYLSFSYKAAGSGDFMQLTRLRRTEVRSSR